MPIKSVTTHILLVDSLQDFELYWISKKDGQEPYNKNQFMFRFNQDISFILVERYIGKLDHCTDYAMNETIRDIEAVKISRLVIGANVPEY